MGTSLVVQWLGTHVPMPGTWVWLVDGLRRFHMPWSKEVCASQLLKPTQPRVCAPQQEKPLEWEENAPQLEQPPLATTKESLHVNNEDPVQPKEKK